ncbi:MAG: AAA family ATPase [Clostridia bacterium]|nr:AAA family ATPase [Clostridia bacterium]
MNENTNNVVALSEIEKDFDPIIGYKSIKSEMLKICDIMRNSEFYSKLGVSVPNGLLLLGEPGLGKTLMSSCFIKASGRKAFICRKDKPDGDFVKHIKNTFDEAVKNAPSIVLLDDMDKFANGDEYHKNSEEFVTVQSCIDDVKNRDVFVLATINEKDAIPKSLLRAGRFDNRITVSAPRGEDAEQIVEHYIKRKKFVSDVDVKTVTRLLNGASCAELETVINQAGIYAGFSRKEKIEMEDIVKACLRIIYKAPEKEQAHSSEILKRVAYHEAGHAVVAEILEPGSVNFVSVRSHVGETGGFTNCYQPEEYWFKKEYMENRVTAILGGKAATEICFGETDVGANNDLNRAYDIVERFVDHYCSNGFDRWIYDHTPSNELRERKGMHMSVEMENFYKKAKKIIVDNREFLDKLAAALMNKDILTSMEIETIKATCNKVA